MPKIRVKRVTSTYLEKFLEKSYNTVNNTTAFTTSGILNSNFKKTMLKKFNTAGKYFRIQQVSSEGNLPNESDPYNDTLTIDFIENQKNIRPLNLPAVKIQNSNDYYITSEEYLLGLNEIPESILGELNEGMKVSDFVVESPNFIDFESYQEQSTSKSKNISLINERYKEDNFTPFKDVDVYSNVSQSFIEDSFIYKDEEYNVGNEKRIEIELDFTDSSDAFLLNTQLFYKTNNFFDSIVNNEPEGLPDDVFVTEQVNFIDQGNTKQSITSHLLPNMVWNNVENRWEYNVVNDNLLKLNSFLYNKDLYDNTKNIEFPNLLTHSYDFGTIDSEDRTNTGIFDQLNYIANTPVAFSALHDNNNNLKNSSEKSYLHNVPTQTYGFPNGNLWKTKKSHSIKLSNYIPSDFLLEKVIFEGKLDIKAELPNAKGNLVNNNQDYSMHPTLSARAPDDSKIFSNNTEFNEEYSHRDFTSGYIASGVNFYILNKIKEESPIEYFDAIEGYTFRKKSDSNYFSNFTLSENDEDNPYVDINFSDLLLQNKIDKLQGNLTVKNYTDNRQIISKGVRNSIYNNLTKDEYNNFYLDRFSTNYFYLDNTDLANIDVNTKNYFSILEDEGINYSTDVYNTLSTNDVTKEFKISSDSDIDTDCYNELVSQNSIGFVKINRAVNDLPRDVTAQDAKVLNTDELQVEYTTNDSMFIDVKDYEFNISSNISSNNSRSEIGENNFKVFSNYRYNKVTPSTLKTNALIYDKSNITSLLDILYAGSDSDDWLKIYRLDKQNNPILFGIPAGNFANYDGQRVASGNEKFAGDIHLNFGAKTENHAVKFQFRFLEVLGDLTYNSFITFINDSGDPNHNTNIINLSCLDNNAFVSALLNGEKIYSDLSVSIEANDPSDDILFETIDNDEKAIVLIRLLSAAFFVAQHILEDTSGNYYGSPFNIFSDGRLYEENNQVFDFLTKQVTESYFSLLTISDDFFNNVNSESNFVFELDYSNSLLLDTDFNSVYNINDLDKFTSESHPSFFEIIFKHQGYNTSTTTDIQKLPTYSAYSPESSEFSYFEDGITVFEEALKEKEIRNIYKSKDQSANKTDIVSGSGKVLDKNIPYFSKEKSGYLIKNSDELAIGINSFTGFNNIISYARLKDKLKIVLLGREVEAKHKNESFESSSIKKSFFGNQRIEMLQKKDKSGKYFQKLQSLNKTYISDSIMPSIIDIFYEFAQKQAVTASTKDSLNYYVSMNDYGRINDSIVSVNKLIVSNKNLGDAEKYSNILTDWHKKYYMSAFKDNDAVAVKQIKNQSALLKERSISGKTYLYFDTNSYSFTSKYDKATKRYFNDIVKNANNTIQAINQNLISTVNEFIVPKEYHIKTRFTLPGNPAASVTDRYYNHSGAKLLYNKTDQTSYELTKDSISEELLRSDSLLFRFRTLANAKNASIQYLNIPGSIPTLFNQNKDYFPNIKGLSYKGSWVLVFEDPEIINDIDLLSYRDIKSKISHYEKFSEDNADIEILHDNTFNIVSNSTLFGKYNHNFYITIKTVNDQEKLFFILPLPYVYYENDAALTIDTGEDIFYNEFFGIDFVGNNMLKNDFESTGSTVYNKLPLTYTEMFSNVDPQDDFDQKYNFAAHQYNSSYFQINFYKNNITLKHPKNENLTNYIRNISKDSIFTKNEFPIYKISTLERFDLIERKAFSVSKEYFDVLENVKNSSNEDLFLNKIISESHIYKKKGNRFVKTQNKILYEVFNEKSYGTGSSKSDNTFINIISVMSKDGSYLNGEIENNLVYDLDKNDIIRIYDEKIMDYNKKYNMNFDIPYIEVDLSLTNPILELDPAPDFTSLAIKYSHYSVDDFDEIPEDADSLTSYGSPIAHINNIDKINRFMFTYSRNNKYNFPIDQTSGYRYGVHSHMPVNVSYVTNTNHYGQFKDRSYSTQNYSLTRIVNGKVYTDYCIYKEFVNEFFGKIDKTAAASREMFTGSNLDTHDRYYHPYIESNDNSDMSHLYT